MKKYFLIVFVACLGTFFSSCSGSGGSSIPLSTAQKIAKTWRISQVLVNGQPDNAGLYANFRLVLQVSADGKATNYTITVGNAPFIPNVNSANNGTWVLQSNDTVMILDASTGSEVRITIPEQPTEMSLKIEWKVPRTINKTEPTITLILVPSV